METVTLPNVIVNNDYDNVFLNRVNDAIALNQNSGKEMYPNITIDSGPYRPHCFAYVVKGDTIHLDFYSAARVFGFQHTIQNIADSIALK